MDGFKLPDPTDMSVDGTCSRCGQCCASLIPVTDHELAGMKAYADKVGFDPGTPPGDDTAVYMLCPFLDRSTTSCRVYPARPAVCRSFSCHLGTDANALKYRAATGADSDEDLPPVQNVWKLYNLTGIRVDGIDMKYDEAPRAVLEDSNGREMTVQAGSAVTLKTKAKGLLPNVLCLDINPEGIIVFNSMEREVQRFAYGDIDEII